MFPKRWDSVFEKQGDYIEGLRTDNLKEIKVLVKKISCALHLKWAPYSILQVFLKVSKFLIEFKKINPEFIRILLHRFKFIIRRPFQKQCIQYFFY